MTTISGPADIVHDLTSGLTYALKQISNEEILKQQSFDTTAFVAKKLPVTSLCWRKWAGLIEQA